MRRQTGLLDQHRHHFGFRATVGGSDGGAQDRLRQDALGKFEEALVSMVDLYIAGIITVGAR
nr:hypothetical protein GCM10020185_25530 [Pseudomonas brassicacearum subsp. brassicacearum]